MSDDINYKSNPLNGVGLKQLVNDLVDHYGYEILYAYLNLNCFKTNASVESAVKFLKRTEWAREKVEAFYLYQYKSMPKASDEQFQLPPRSRIMPEGDVPGEPAELSLEDAERLREKRERKAAAHDANRSRSLSNRRADRDSHYSRPRKDKGAASAADDDPWKNWR
ncbi:VF530 family DNA-binding protein [Agaribacterium sp. ZY112]|uniref:VF530 family protein n=1 Tax=Agaribacterium sp. ZY112 TaxID=3233574 RepID=UPI00352437F6